MAMAGRGLIIQVGTAVDGPWSDVQDLNDASMSLGGDNLDVSTFGTDFIKRLQGLKDGSYSLGGFYNPTDTNGQVAIRNTWMNDTPLFVRYLPDGSTGFMQEVKVSGFEVSAAVDGVVEVSIDLEGNGEITMVV